MRGGLLFLCAVAACTAQSYRIETVAGTGVPGADGDGIPAYRAQFNTPSGIALDSSGRLYVADKDNNRIRRIDLDGSIRTVAADIESPTDVAVDSNGAVYIASGTSIRTLIAGNIGTIVAAEAGLQPIQALAIEPGGTLLAAEDSHIVRIGRDGSVTQVAALPAAASGVAVAQDGTIYAAAADTIYKIGSDGLPTPFSSGIPVNTGSRLTVDRWGDLYISGPRITKVVNGTAYLLAGTDAPGFSGDGGLSEIAQVNSPAGLAVDAAGNVFFADTLNQRIRVLRAPYAGSINAVTPGNGATEAWPRNLILSWTPLVNARSYDLFFGTSPDALQFAGTTSDPFFGIDRLTDRTTYYWRVRTRFAPLPPIDSPVFSFTTTTSSTQTPPIPDSPAPANFAAGQPLALTLSWRGSASSRYEVFFGEDVNTASRIGITTEPKFTVSNLKADTLYYWRVLAVNDAGQTVSQRWQFSTGSAAGYPWIIQTLAGTTLPTADGTVSTDAVLTLPRNPVADSAGNIYFIDANRTVRRIGIDGKLGTAFSITSSDLAALSADLSQNLYIATPEYVVRINRAGQRAFIAGQPGRRGYSGDNGSATQAVFDNITSIAADRRGNVYIADSNNNRIRIITPGGTIRSFAGTGTCGETDGNGDASSLPLCKPSQIAVDGSGNLYVYASGLVLRITSDGSSQRVTDTQIGTANGIAADANGNVYLLDSGLVHRIDGSGAVTTFAAGLTGTGLAIDGLGNLLVGDTYAHRIRRIDPSGFVATVAGSDTTRGDRGSPTQAFLYGPTDVATDGTGAVYIADSLNHRIRRVAFGSIDTVAGGGNDPVAGTETLGRNARDLRLDLSSGGSVEFDAAGNLLFNTKRDSDVILGIQPNSTVARYLEPRIGTVGGIARGLGGEIYVSDKTGHRILRFERDGTSVVVAGTGVAGFAGEGGPAALAQVNTPGALAVSPDGELYVAELSRVRRITLDGRIVNFVNETAQGLAFDSFGRLFVSAGNSIYMAVGDPRNFGQFTLSRLTGIDNAQLVQPRGLAFTTGGDLIFADAGANRVFTLTRNVPTQVLATSGEGQKIQQNGFLQDPLIVTVTGRSGLPVPGVGVRFQVTSGTVNPIDLGSGTTNANGQARWTFIGNRTGNVTVRATVAGLPPVEFQLQGN